MKESGNLSKIYWLWLKLEIKPSLERPSENVRLLGLTKYPIFGKIGSELNLLNIRHAVPSICGIYLHNSCCFLIFLPLCQMRQYAITLVFRKLLRLKKAYFCESLGLLATSFKASILEWTICGEKWTFLGHPWSKNIPTLYVCRGLIFPLEQMKSFANRAISKPTKKGLYNGMEVNFLFFVRTFCIFFILNYTIFCSLQLMAANFSKWLFSISSNFPG